MLSRSFHNAKHEVETLGISTEEAIKRHGEWMTAKEENLIRNMEVKTMKKAVRKTDEWNRVRNVTSISYANGIKIEPMKKAPKTAKVSDCKDYKAITAGFKTTYSKYIAVIKEAECCGECDKILHWIEIDKRLTEAEKADLTEKAEARSKEITEASKKRAERVMQYIKNYIDVAKTSSDAQRIAKWLRKDGKITDTERSLLMKRLTERMAVIAMANIA